MAKPRPKEGPKVADRPHPITIALSLLAAGVAATGVWLTYSRNSSSPAPNVTTAPATNTTREPSNVRPALSQEKERIPMRPMMVSLGGSSPDRLTHVELKIGRSISPIRGTFYELLYTLQERASPTDPFKNRVEMLADVGDSAAARGLAQSGLSQTQMQYLIGPVTIRARALPPNTSHDKALEDLIRNVLNQ